MTVQITINAENAKEARREMWALLGVDPYSQPETADDKIVAVTPPTITLSESEYKEDLAAQSAEKIANETAPAPEVKPAAKKATSKKAAALPKTVETPAEVKAQDNADEAAEQVVVRAAAEEKAIAKDPSLTAPVLTLDDVRRVANKYVQRFGYDAANEDLAALLEPAVGQRAISKLPADNQEILAKAVAVLTDAYTNDPLNREGRPEEEEGAE